MGASKNAKRSPPSGAVLADTGDMKSFALLRMDVCMGLAKSSVVGKQSGPEGLYGSTTQSA